MRTESIKLSVLVEKCKNHIQINPTQNTIKHFVLVRRYFIT